jgi:hypothetical protein
VLGSGGCAAPCCSCFTQGKRPGTGGSGGEVAPLHTDLDDMHGVQQGGPELEYSRITHHISYLPAYIKLYFSFMTVVMMDASSKRYFRNRGRTCSVDLRGTKLLRLTMKSGHKGKERGKMDKRKGCVWEEKIRQVLV